MEPQHKGWRPDDKAHVSAVPALSVNCAARRASEQVLIGMRTLGVELGMAVGVVVIVMLLVPLSSRLRLAVLLDVCVCIPVGENEGIDGWHGSAMEPCNVSGTLITIASPFSPQHNAEPAAETAQTWFPPAVRAYAGGRLTGTTSCP